jgi:hypothetical protein
MNDEQTWAISSLPLEQFRVRFDDKAAVPTIQFNLKPNRTQCVVDSMQEIMNDCVEYAVLTVRPEDWPTQIDLPLNEDKK